LNSAKTMAYFVTKRDAEETKVQGKQIGRRELSSSRLMKGPSRDQRLNEAIAAINANEQEDFIKKKMDTSEPKVTGKGHNNEMVVRHWGANVFALGKPSPPPKLRIRPDVSEENLAKLMREDHRKEDAAEGMGRDDPPWEKILKNDYPVPRNTNIRVIRKKYGERESYESGPPHGFSGMGKHCKPEPPRRMKPKTDEEFVPEFHPVRRLNGKRVYGHSIDCNPLIPEQHRIPQTHRPQRNENFN